jgi:hypothetical protein
LQCGNCDSTSWLVADDSSGLQPATHRPSFSLALVPRAGSASGTAGRGTTPSFPIYCMSMSSYTFPRCESEAKPPTPTWDHVTHPISPLHRRRSSKVTLSPAVDDFTRTSQIIPTPISSRLTRRTAAQPSCFAPSYLSPAPSSGDTSSSALYPSPPAPLPILSPSHSPIPPSPRPRHRPPRLEATLNPRRSGRSLNPWTGRVRTSRGSALVWCTRPGRGARSRRISF